jgi:hypothetical protein
VSILDAQLTLSVDTAKPSLTCSSFPWVTSSAIRGDRVTLPGGKADGNETLHEMAPHEFHIVANLRMEVGTAGVAYLQRDLEGRMISPSSVDFRRSV